MRRLLIACSVLSVVLSASQGFAQWYRGPGWGGGWGGAYGGFGAQTPFSANAMGYADVIRAQGQFNLDSSQAAINAQQAKSAYIDNSVKWVQAYYERKHIFQAERDRQLAQERATRERLRSMPRESGAPPRLTSSQIDPSTGRIDWPDALLAPQFDAVRTRLDDLYETRSSTNTSARLAREIHDTARAMQAELKGDIRNLLPNHYIEARKFLDSLAWEGQFPPGA